MNIKRSLQTICAAGLCSFATSPAAQASSQYQHMADTASNAAAVSTLREAESVLVTYFNVHNESFGSSRFPLVKALNRNARELVFRVAGRNHIVHNSGMMNNPRAVAIYDVKPGRFGGVLACVGSLGTRNYCVVIFGNNATQRFTLFKKGRHSNGVANKPGAGGYGRIIPGDPSTPARFIKPTAVRGKWLGGSWRI